MATSARLEELKTRFDENPRRYFAPLANEYRKMGDLARAIEICRSHLPAQPAHVSGHIVLAQALFEAGETEEARGEFEAALEYDPENLIALRFMGDIARSRSDLDSARAWYERVLDADPRNDEVSGYLRELNESPRDAGTAPAVTPSVQDPTPVVTLSLDAAMPAPPAAAPAAESETDAEARATRAFYETLDLAQGMPASDASPDDVVDASSPRADWTAATPDAPLEDDFFTADIDESAFLDSAVLETDRPGGAMPVPEPGSSPPASDSHDASATADFEEAQPAEASDSVAFSDFAAVPEDWFTAPAPSAQQSVTPPSESADASSIPDDLDSWFDGPGAAPSGVPVSQQEGHVPASPTPEPTELSSVTDDFLPDLSSEPAANRDDEAESFAASLGSTPAWLSPPSGDAGEMGGEPDTIEAYADAVEERSPQSSPGVDPDGSEAAWPSASPSDASAGESAAPPASSAPHDASPAPFMTETLAELYLRQGFRDEALAIYRRLSERSPFDSRLRERVATLEHEIATAAAEAVPVRERSPLAAVTVREFFSSLARRQPFAGARPGGTGPSAAGNDPEPSRSDVGAAPAARDVPVDFAPSSTGGASSPYASGSHSALAQLFSAASPSEVDSSAATTLASAFDVGHGAPTPPGRPSRMGDHELSLDHLFRENAQEAARAVSMDEFYTSAAKAETADAAPEGTPGEERDSDITQFSAWLEGLKKK